MIVDREKDLTTNIRVSDIAADPDQPRKQFSELDLDRLAASLRGCGQLQPIRVRPAQEAGEYIVIAGERRWRAAQRGGLDFIEATIVTKPLSDADVLEQQLVENALRVDLKPIEQAISYQDLMAQRGWNGVQLAKALSLSPPSVSRSLKLLTLPKPLQELVNAGTLKPSVAYALAQVDDPARQHELAEQAAAGALTRDALETILQQPKAAAKRVQFECAGGLRVSLSADREFSISDMIRSLSELVAHARKQQPSGVSVKDFAKLLAINSALKAS